MKTKTSTNKWLAIATFYVIAVAVRALIIFNEPEASLMDLSFTTCLWGWGEGLGPCLGAIAAVLIFKRKFYCTLTGTSLIKTLICVLLPLVVCFSLNMKLSLILLHFIAYSLLEEIGWRGYLQGEFQHMNRYLRPFVIAIMWYFWHLNFQLEIQNLIFFLILLVGSWGIGCVARDSRSLLTCAVLHCLGNFSMHGFFEFTPTVLGIYIAIFICWHIVWYVPWKKLAGRLQVARA